jgi:DNA-binding response OmpR family regulator
MKNHAVSEMNDDQGVTFPLPGINAMGIRVAVLDDDLLFLKVVERYAKQVGIEVTTAATVHQFAEVVSGSKYDVAVIDYYLDNDKGTEIAESVTSLPIIITSRKSDWAKSEPDMPASIKEFVHKKYGAKIILQRALKIALLRRATGKF